MDHPKPPSEEELNKLVRSLAQGSGAKVVEEVDPRENDPRTKMLDAIRHVMHEHSVSAHLVGFVFAGVCRDGITPTLYAVSNMNSITARLLIGELNLLIQRLSYNLNVSEDSVADEDTED